MKRFTLFVVLLCITSLSFAQNQRACGTMQHLETQLEQDPDMQQRMQAIESFTQQVITNGNNARAVDGVITIPVVVHVLYNVNRPQENISDAQIQSQIDVLNEDFRRLNADAANTLPEFLGVAADTEIEFCLASVDPEGNPTSGIERRSSTRGSWGTGNLMKRSSSGGLDAWPRNSYLNMWSCNIGGGILGFATFPGGPAADDGVVVSPNYFGSKDFDTNNDFYLSSPFDLGRTMTHEVGHWLNLRHIWGDGPCFADDFVGDTPKSDASNYGCPLSHQSCGNKDMVQNYMDYTNDACMNIYTQGQKDRARALFEPGGARAAMLDSEGCGTAEPVCLPPTGILVDAGDGIATINFNGAFFGDAYVIELATWDGPFEEVATVNDPEFGTISNITYTLDDLDECTEYTVQISAICDNLQGYETSQQVFFFTTGEACEPPSCDTPENQYATNITWNQATLGWDEVEGATQYRVQGRLRGGLGIFVRTVFVESNSFRTRNLFPFLTYEYRVQAICDGIGSSPFTGWYPFTLNPLVNRGDDVIVPTEGLEEVKLFDTDAVLTLFPNPSSGQSEVRYRGVDLDNVTMTVTDVTGKEVRSYQMELVANGTTSIDLTDLQNGMYLLTFRQGSILLDTEKLLLTK